MPMHLKVVPCGRAEWGLGGEFPFYAIANVNPRLRIRRQGFIRLHVLRDVAAKLLAFRIEIRMVKIQEHFALLDPLSRNRIVCEDRTKYGTTIRLEGKQITILLFARIKDNRAFKFYGVLVSTANAWWEEWEIVTFASRTAVL